MLVARVTFLVLVLVAILPQQAGAQLLNPRIGTVPLSPRQFSNPTDLPTFQNHLSIEEAEPSYNSRTTTSRRIPGRYIVVLKNSIDRPGKVAEAQTDASGRDLRLVFRTA